MIIMPTEKPRYCITVDDETLKEMQEQAEEEYHNHMDQHWGNYESLESLTYMGDYL